MKHSFFVGILAAISLSSCSSISQTTQQQSRDSTVVRDVADGVVHRHIVRPDGPWNIHALAIDLNRAELDIISARAFDSLNGRETTSSIAKRLSTNDRTVIGAINADFFNMQSGENDLSQVIEGEIVKGVKKPLRAQFAVGVSRTPYIERFRFYGMALTREKRVVIDAVNALRDSAVVLLNHFYKRHTRSEDDNVLALRTVGTCGDTLVAIVLDSVRVGNQFEISDSIQLLRAKRRTELNEFVLGDTVRLLLGFIPQAEKIRTLVGGLPRLVVDGKSIVQPDSMEGVSRKFIETRHPRTGVGFSRDGKTIYFVTVDGRQASSVGMSLSEFADLMIELGCYRALNLDGGGSTTMVVEGRVINSPSDAAGERPVANALLVVKKANAERTR